MKKICLTIAGSDSSGGAGIQADIKSISANGAYAMSVITLLTAQNSHSISKVKILDKELIEAQIDSLFSDYEIDAVKIGSLGNKEVIEIVINSIKKWEMKNIVVDPVMISKSGVKLIDDKAIKKMTELIKCADLITPNLYEAKCLINNVQYKDKDDLLKKLTIRFPNKNFLLKDGHGKDDVITDILLYKNKKHYFSHSRYITKNTHGTGCTLSSAIAANLAKGFDMITSVKISIKYVENAIKNNLDYGKLHGPLDHFYKDSN